jgi:hypothetical protein
VREQEADREEGDTEEEKIEENRDEVRGDSPLPIAHLALEYDNDEGDTRVEPQHEHKQIEDGEDGTFERKTLELGENEVHEQGELKYKPSYNNGVQETTEGEDYRIQEHDDGTTHPASPTTPSAAVNPALHEPRQFNWATNNDQLIGPVPCVTDFRPTKPLSPFASPIPAPHLLANPVTPPQPVHALPKPTVTPSNGDVAPRMPTPAMGAPADCTPAAHNPTKPALTNLEPVVANNPNHTSVHSVHASTAPVDPVPIEPDEPAPCLSDNRITAPQPVRAPPKPTVTPSKDDTAPCAPTEHTPAAFTPTLPIVHSPRDLSGLRSSS